MRIIKRSLIVKNLTVFVVLSLMFLKVIEAINSGNPTITNKIYLEIWNSHTALCIFSLLTIMLVLNLKKLSLVLTGVYFAWILGEGIIIFSNGFNKIVLIHLFIYVVSAFFLFLFWKIEMGSSIYNPFFYSNELGDKTEYKLKGRVYTSWGETFECSLSNWDKEGFFAIIDKEFEGKRVHGDIEVSFMFEGKMFRALGEIVTNYGNGIGVRTISEKSKDLIELNWTDLYGIISDRGYKPRG